MSTLASRARPRGSTRALALRAPAPELAALLAVAGVLNLWALSRNGYANEYYAAAVKSMAGDWKAFLFNSFDSSLVMTLDKPPLATWVQALSVRAFGYSSWSILVPQALMGVASVALVYDLVRRRFGRVAGFAGGAVLALTPIAVAISRHNNPDALLALCSVAAVWCTARALETASTRWLVWAGVAVGLGFETKMGAALLVVPGIVVAWLWVTRKVVPLLAGGLAMAVVGLAWPVLMWLVPAGSRPWISGTADNSIWSLITNYNGVGRLSGQAGGPGGIGRPGGGGPGGLFGGDTGPLRLLDASLGGQAGWLLGFAIVAGAAVLLASRLRRTDTRTGWVIAVGGAFATTAVAFSYASGIFHPYYVSALAPFTAALVGAGAGQLASGDEQARWLAPVAIAGGILTELYVVGHDATGTDWVEPLLLVVGVATGAVLVLRRTRRIRLAAIVVALAALVAAPAAWAVQTLGHAANGTFPAGGPATAGMGGPGGRPGGMGGGFRGFAPPQGFAPPRLGTFGGRGRAGGMFGGEDLTTALTYIKAHGGGTLAISSQSGAATAVRQGYDVAGIGGFSGRESEVSVAWLADAVRDGKIRWVLTSGGGPGGMRDTRTGSTTAMAAVEQACTPASTAGGALYDCSGRAAALAAG